MNELTKLKSRLSFARLWCSPARCSIGARLVVCMTFSRISRRSFHKDRRRLSRVVQAQGLLLDCGPADRVTSVTRIHAWFPVSKSSSVSPAVITGLGCKQRDGGRGVSFSGSLYTVIFVREIELANVRRLSWKG